MEVNQANDLWHGGLLDRVKEETHRVQGKWFKFEFKLNFNYDAELQKW